MILDFSEVENVLSSFSSTVFSLEIMRLVAMMMNLALGVTWSEVLEEELTRWSMMADLASPKIHALGRS